MNNITLYFSSLILLLSLSTCLNAQEGYYILGKEKLEFRRIVDPSKEAGGPHNVIGTRKGLMPIADTMEAVKNMSDWEEMFDINGKKYLAFKRPEFDAKDVEGVLIRKFPSGDKDKYQICVYFRKDSWDKVSDTTKRLVGKKAGVVRHNKLLNTAVVGAPFGHTTVFSDEGFDLSEIKWVVAGFILGDKPSDDEREREYMSWLEGRVKRVPDDLDAMKTLAYRYMYDEPVDYERAAVLFENILQKDPSMIEQLSDLAECHFELKKYDKAIETYKKAIESLPYDDWGFRISLARVYWVNGEKDKAKKELEKSLKLVEKAPLPDIPGVPTKEAIIETINAQLESLKKSME